MYPEQRDRVTGDFLEIGPGRGDLLLDLAARYPDKQFVAVELAGRRYFKLIKRLQKRDIENVHLLWGPAQVAVPKHVVPESFERVYVLFPDPWPKKRHAHHRLLQIDFIRLLLKVLEPGGSFFFATDFTEYASWVVENLAGISELDIQGTPYSSQEQIADYFPTFFEKKWREEGRKIYYLQGLKK